jgi:hypothetical protein
MKTISYQYGDGSGNQYIISNDSIEYIPVKKEFSSTGLYDGGEYVKKGISISDFEKISNEVNSLFNSKHLHIDDRIKTSGIITIMENKKMEDSAIIKNSENKDRFENLLKNLIK